MKRFSLIFALVLAVLPGTALAGQRINRREVVSRHNVTTHATLPKSPAQVGNGHFAYNFDITGAQTFVPFNTLSDWGWHSSPLPPGVELDDYKPVPYESHGRTILYRNSNPDAPEITKYLTRNPHRMNLGRIGLVLLKDDGTAACEADLDTATQHIDLWSGRVESRFSLGGAESEVVTLCHPTEDIVALKIRSQLITSGRLKAFIEFPYPDEENMKDYVGLYDVPSKHLSNLNTTQHGAIIERTVDTVHYCASLNWSRDATLAQVSPHRFEITPDSTSGRIDLCIRFSKKATEAPIATSATRLIRRIERLSAREWKRYWESGAAIDLSGSTDPRWMELERRAVLSQYIMKLNETGTFFPQESGLVRNTWYGRSHLEMVWWHAVHFALWGRPKEFGSYMECYRDFLPEARARAAEEGRTGARWPKCVGEINREWPGDAHAFLLWQMPHPIYFAEQMWRENHSEATLSSWREIVLETAAYMADNLFYDEQRGEYVMGPPVYMVSENAAAGATVNPCFELAYWRYGIETALKWQERLGLERDPRWEDILQHLAPLPVEDGLYVSYEGIEGQWSEKNFEHPAITGIYGMLPGNGVDTAAVARTLEKVVGCWQWGDRIWGWDFPMMAMCAARCGMPELALDLLLHPCFKAQFDPHGYSKSWPIPYFPANGGELAAIAMMCGGWDGCDTSADAPGFPRDGTWKVRHEGFRKMQ